MADLHLTRLSASVVERQLWVTVRRTHGEHISSAAPRLPEFVIVVGRVWSAPYPDIRSHHGSIPLMCDGFISGIFGCGSVRKALSLADRCLFARRVGTRHIQIF